MSLTSYERLRIVHRTLLMRPPSESALRELLAELPAYLDNIASIRPALADEVDNSRQLLQRIKVHFSPTQLANKAKIVQNLHEALAPLFDG